ncbi:MAG: integrase core domain-containing protein [Nitrospira sp.]|nr:integrase core domain-containing protein [Nitrospira sp.]
MEVSTLRDPAAESDVGQRLDEAEHRACAMVYADRHRLVLSVFDCFDGVPTVNTSQVQALYRQRLRTQGISSKASTKPASSGSGLTEYGMGDESLQGLGADLSFTRVRQPTDNAITARFYGSIKQGEIYVVGNYPDERSAREEIGRYITDYNHRRPNQSLMNFTLGYVHQINNKNSLLAETTSPQAGGLATTVGLLDSDDSGSPSERNGGMLGYGQRGDRR